jgi:predicted CXXCH cytochrome family protein
VTRAPARTRTAARCLAGMLLAAVPALPLAAGKPSAPTAAAGARAVAGGRGGIRASKHGQLHRKRDAPPGTCVQCHDGHRSAADAPPEPNALCIECHQTALPGSSFQGAASYAQSAHGSTGSMAWPGPTPPARPSAEGGACVTCHDPHGRSDESGPIGSMLVTRGEALCLACHSGAARTDVAAQLRKPYRHGAAPAAGQSGSCAECHNAHLVRTDGSAARAPEASPALAGVRRVRVTNGAPGAAPVYTVLDATDPTPALEYQICFKCHSGYSKARRIGSPDLAILLNPANASFHPVEAPGRNRGIDFRAFATGWSSDQLVLCTDCHGSDDTTVRGLHGSNARYLLKARYDAGPAQQRVLPDDLCFRCHAWETYASPTGGAAWGYSRFRLHASHASSGASCFGCHESHGSVTLPALLATGRAPGMAVYTQTPSGGSCTSSCHVSTPASATYTVAYPR